MKTQWTLVADAASAPGRDSRELSDKELKPAGGCRRPLASPITWRSATGQVAQETIKCANKGMFNLIVPGSKGRGAAAELLLGPVAQKVLVRNSQSSC
ncbi:universal stress protein [Variovorax humicola]|uniref:Universal stress protein n=1 Tax=Variovorax humicola TaxID=1769758 RepID=A0ABU8W9H3_9BURK